MFLTQRLTRIKSDTRALGVYHRLCTERKKNQSRRYEHGVSSPVTRKITLGLGALFGDTWCNTRLIRHASQESVSLVIRSPAESLEPHRPDPPDSRTSRPTPPPVEGQSDKRQLHPSVYLPYSIVFFFLVVPLTHPGLRTLSSALVRMTPRRENETRPSRLLT